MKTEITLKINSVVMDYILDVCDSNFLTVEENIERYLKEVLNLYDKSYKEGVQ